MRIMDFNLDRVGRLIKGWRFDRHDSTSRTAIFRRGRYHRAVIGASRKIVLCKKLDFFCGKDTRLRKRVADILKNVTDPFERCLALRFAFEQVVLDENDINYDGYIWYGMEEYGRVAGASSCYAGAVDTEPQRSFIDWDITDVPASTVTDVDWAVEVITAYGAGDTVRICSFDGTQVDTTNYPVGEPGDENLFNDIAGKTELIAAAADFQSTGSKTIDLGEMADAKLQANLGVDFWSIGFKGSDESTDHTRIDAAAGTTPPNLIVTYDPC